MLSNTPCLLIYIIVVLFSALSLAEDSTQSEFKVYKQVDEKGNVTFSDQQSPNAVEIALPKTNTTKTVAPPKKPASTQPAASTRYTAVLINTPPNGTVIPNGLIPLAVTASTIPPLHEQHALQLIVDGAVHSNNRTGSFTLPTVPRGSHTLQVNVVGEDDTVIQRSSTTTIHVYRPGG